VSVDTRDRDADGRDDIAAKLTLTGTMRPFSGAVGAFPTVPPVSASVAFLDRPAGLSRDPSEPEASLSSFVVEKGLLASAKKKDTADRVAAAVHQIRRFRALVCEESGRAAVTTSAGSIRCGIRARSRRPRSPRRRRRSRSAIRRGPSPRSGGSTPCPRSATPGRKTS
jgi:hypothetical protein